MSLFQTLDGRLGDDKPVGITPLDIADLPRLQRQIMFFVLRDQQAALDGMTVDRLQHQFESETDDHLLETLTELCKIGWLIMFGEAPNSHYKVNLRRKRGTALNGVWSFVMDRVEKDKPPTADPASAPLTDAAKSDQVWDYVTQRLSDKPLTPWTFKF